MLLREWLRMRERERERENENVCVREIEWECERECNRMFESVCWQVPDQFCKVILNSTSLQKYLHVERLKTGWRLFAVSWWERRPAWKTWSSAPICNLEINATYSSSLTMQQYISTSTSMGLHKLEGGSTGTGYGLLIGNKNNRPYTCNNYCHHTDHREQSW